MHINRLSIFSGIICLLVLFAPVTTLGVPVPPLESHTETAWKVAWEDAWKIAWDSAWKSVDVAAVPAQTTESDLENGDAGLWDMPPAFEDELTFDLSVSWGAPLGTQLGGPQDFPLSLAAAEQAADPLDYGKLYIQAEPADAEISLRGVDQAFSQGMILAPGTYIVDIRQSGYLAQTRRIDLLSGMAATLDVALTPEAPEQAAAPQQQPRENATEAATQAQLYKTLLTPDTAENHAADLPAGDVADAQPEARPQARQPASQGALYVSTEPADATVRILHIKPIFHQGIELAPGRYTIDAASDGFERNVTSVEISPNQETRIHLALEKALPKAKLFVRTQPAGATVRILNIKPVFHQGIELTHGEYLLDAQLDGHKTITQTIQLAPGEEKDITLMLPEAPPPGRLYVQTTPSEAQVRILNIKPKFEQGLQLEPGEYTIDAQLDGYRTEVKKVSIVSGGQTQISLQLAKAPETGRLFVRTEPAGAAVRVLDIKPKFKQGMELDQGEYTIDAQLDGYRTEIQKIQVAPGQDNTIQVKLVKAPEKGKLFVSTDPGGAKVRILNIKPVFHQGIELAPGSYVIDAHLSGHATAVERINITPGQETHISLALAPALEPETTADGTAAPQQYAAAASAAPGLPQKDVAAYDVEAFVSMAVLAINSGNYQAAINAGDHALALDPGCAEALKIKGDAYLLLEEYDNALAQYDQALAIANDRQVQVNRDYAFEQLEKEIKLLQAAKAVQPKKSAKPHQFALDN